MARKLKNFLIWTTGFLSAFVTVGAVGAIAVFAVPVGTYVNNNDQLVGDSISERSLYSLIMNYSDITVEDLPIIKTALSSAVSGSEISKYVSIDWDQFNEVSFDDLSNIQSIMGSAIQVTATMNSLGLGSQLGSFGNLEVMQDWTELTAEEKDAIDTATSDFVAALYWYKTSDNNYARAYNDDKTLVAEAEGQALYYPALLDVNLLDLFSVIQPRLTQNSAKQLVSCFSDLGDDSIISKVLGDKTIAEIGSIEPGDIKINSIADIQDNETLSAILCEGCNVASVDDLTLADIDKFDLAKVHLSTVVSGASDLVKNFMTQATGKENFEDVSLADLSSENFESGRCKLTTFIPATGNEKLYNCLVDACFGDQASGKTASDITLDDLTSDSFDMGKVKLGSVITASDDMNPILKCLLDGGATLNNLSESINNLSIYDAYGSEVFVQDSSKSLTGDKYVVTTDEDGKVLYYTYDSVNGTYYMDKDAGIWALLSFSITTDGDTGRGAVYTVSTTGNISNMSTTATFALKNATIYQLIAAGLIDDNNYKTDLKKMTMTQVLNALDNPSA